MTDTQNIGSSVLNNLSIYRLLNDSEKQETSFGKLSNLSSVIDTETIQKLKDGDYDITLKTYTDLNSYKSIMSSLYGDNSANKFSNYLKNRLYNNEKSTTTAKDFLDKMKEYGISNSSAIKMYSAINKYSLASTMKENYSYVNAKI